MKTIEEWLNELPNPCRHLALKNHSAYNKFGKADCLANALVLAFSWTNSKERGVYWKEIHEMCLSGKFDKEPTTIPSNFKKEEKKKIKKKFISDNKKSETKIAKPEKIKTLKITDIVEDFIVSNENNTFPDLDSALVDYFKLKTQL